MTRPVDAVIAVTYRCNARCAMCGIWQSAPGEELPPSAYDALPPDLRDVNLTGGEPFLRDDLPDIHAALRRACPRARTVVSTNGFLTDRILDHVRRMRQVEPGLGLALSMDGPAEVHDRLRSVPGGHARTLRTLKALQAEGVRNLRLAFTLTPANAGHFGEVYDLARARGVEFTCAVQHASEHYFRSEADSADLATDAVRGQLESVVRRELRSWRPKSWARAYFMHGLWEFVRGRGRLHPCRAGRDFLFLDPAGELYTCNAMPFRMGNLRAGFETAWRSGDATGARGQADRCAACWMICTARVAIKRAWPQALGWALRRKFAPAEVLRP